MNKFLNYKGYSGSVEFSAEDACFFGEILGIKSKITFEGKSVKEIIDDFHESIDEYINFCTGRGIEPEKPFKGSFNVRINPELHRKAAVLASEKGISLNKLIENAVKQVALF